MSPSTVRSEPSRNLFGVKLLFGLNIVLNLLFGFILLFNFWFEQSDSVNLLVGLNLLFSLSLLNQQFGLNRVYVFKFMLSRKISVWFEHIVWV